MQVEGVEKIKDEATVRFDIVEMLFVTFSHKIGKEDIF